MRKQTIGLKFENWILTYKIEIQNYQIQNYQSQKHEMRTSKEKHNEKS